ncbi:MAG: hypothetical protein KDA91_00115 [Planctomycetaceae bacterium]|nr:hypothetical protein [Planctomycetaceae bacterium]
MGPDTGHVFLLFGCIVAFFGICMVGWHVRQHRRHQEDLELSASDQRFFDHQYRRRMQTSALTVTLGALISLWDTLPAVAESPIFATFYVLGLLLLAFWLVLLAFSDAVASRVHVSQSLRRNQKAHKALHDAVEELRRQQRLDFHGDEHRRDNSPPE